MQNHRRTYNLELQQMLRDNPNSLLAIGLEQIEVLGTGTQGVVVSDRKNPQLAHKILIPTINLPNFPDGVFPISSATYNPPSELILNDSVFLDLTEEQLIRLQSSMAEVVYLGLVKDKKNVQQIRVVNDPMYGVVPNRRFFSINHQFVVMYTFDRIYGDSLERKLLKKELDISRQLQIHSDLIIARAENRGVGVVHRDIKPDNIIINNAHTVLIDYGIAQLVDGVDLRDPFPDRVQLLENVDPLRLIVRGTLAYIAPEAVPTYQAPLGIITPSIDLFAQGSLFYRGVKGITPTQEKVKYKSVSDQEFIRSICTYSIVEWETHRDDLCKYLNRELADGAAMMFHPQMELRTDEKFNYMLQRILSGKESIEQRKQVVVPSAFASFVNPNVTTVEMLLAYMSDTEIIPVESPPSQVQQTLL